MATMFQPDSFGPLQFPELPSRPAPPTGLTEAELEQMVIAPTCDACDEYGKTTLHIAVKDIGTGMIPVLYMNTLTHSHRNRLDHYVLAPYSQADIQTHTNWHVGSINIPEGITDMVGVIPLPENSFDNGEQPGTDRHAYKALRENIKPLWTGVETIAFGNGSLNALVNAGQEKSSPKHHVVEEKRLYSTELKGILKSPVNAWMYLPNTPEINHVLLVTDGRDYIESAQLLPHIGEANTAVVLFAPQSENDRQQLLGDLNTLRTTLTEHVLPWARGRAVAANYHWPERSEDFTIAGGSLGGYAAAAVVLYYPGIARNAIVQSASLWWPDKYYKLLEDWTLIANEPDGHERIIFHEYGEFDFHLANENKELARQLRKADNVISTSRRYKGGHDYINWRQGILDGHDWISRTRRRIAKNQSF